MKTRLDNWLTEHGLVPSRQKAQALILAGCVYVNNQKVTKVAHTVRDEDHVELRGKDHPYVSRGGVKLAHAIESFDIPVQGRVAVDIGASTGGFTDCLLKNGAKRVYAVDVGYGQLDWKLRQDERVVCIERCNARYWEAAEVVEPIGLITIDISFISIKTILPNILEVLDKKLDQDVYLVVLIKPQFEAGPSDVSSGGVVREESVHERVIQDIRCFIIEQGLEVIGVIPSPIRGPKGNVEYLLVAKIEASNQ